MGVTERKEREKLERRNAIIVSAEKIFFKEGIENASMEQIAQEAELSKGTLYLYFKSKEELYHIIILRGFIELRKRLREATQDETATGLQHVKSISEAYIKFSNDHLGYFNAILYYQNDNFSSKSREPSEIQSLRGGNAVIEILVQAILRGKNDKSISLNVNEVETAFVLWSQLTGLLQVIERKMSIITYHYRIKQSDLFTSYFELLEKSLK